MKKYFLLILITLSCLPAIACDICGCGVGSYYLGILPEYNKRFVGLRYQHKTLMTHLGPLGERTPNTADETYQSIELWGGWNIGNKFRVLAFIPYNFNDRKAQTGNGYKDGLGDIALMGYYNAFNHRSTVGEKLLVQSLWVGAGVKAPTGKYEPNERLQVSESPNNFQLGTSSTDFTLNAAYDIRLMDLGLNLNANYKINTENKYAYRYGNKLTLNGLLYYKWRFFNKLSIGPNAGLLYETSQNDVESGKYTVDVSGGYALSLVGGIEANFGRFSAGANYQNIASQHLANNRAIAGDRLMVHFSVAF
ncbi:transporter family protein [Mucilaginibacter myungsuensis]|uniref:Transporter n=1 Tax=Mucilaginibacter myungsuensis TaxID=649104 RepID=A0A929L172_9SPHI|nr:transporter [Mucilaginibacter myungsuensis]MBE9661381.1 transporter [Mucilaginibacter myungsuensis]MDN3597524.1 transporter [Mucilaginibacter myungsuensis]